MKIKKSEMKTCRTAYIYGDGHVVLLHEKTDPDAGPVEWATIYENMGAKIYLQKGGRIIVNDSALPFFAQATEIAAKAASTNAGSENTKKLGLAVETISIKNGACPWPWHISTFPGILSAQIKYQPDIEPETFGTVKDKGYWGSVKIKAIYTDKAA